MNLLLISVVVLFHSLVLTNCGEGYVPGLNKTKKGNGCNDKYQKNLIQKTYYRCHCWANSQSSLEYE
jgi:hypothetical protein